MSEVSAHEFDKIYAVFGVRKPMNSEKGVFFSNKQIVESVLDYLNNWHQGRFKIVSGGSHGVEMIAEEWAFRNKIAFERVKPILHENMIAAFDVRNEKIIDKSTDLLVWWDAEDTLIGRTLREGIRRGRKVEIFPVTYE